VSSRVDNKGEQAPPPAEKEATSIQHPGNNNIRREIKEKRTMTAADE